MLEVAGEEIGVDDATDAKERRLLELLGAMPSAVVAFSGGVDSSYLAFAAARALGERALAVTALSPSVPEVQRAMARRVAATVRIRHLEIDTREVDDPAYRKNALDRCYFCKSELYGRLSELALLHGWKNILSGTNSDDLGDFRPGLNAAAEQQVRHPLVEAALGKSEIRRLSRRAGLPTWDVPASPCLASRIPFGQEVTVEKLSQVETAEEALRRLGLVEFRVRHHGDLARIEVPAALIGELLDDERRAAIVAAVRAAGFRHVAVDLEGFRSGSLHAGLR